MTTFAFIRDFGKHYTWEVVYMPSFMEDGKLFNLGLKMILCIMFGWWCDIICETTKNIIHLFCSYICRPFTIVLWYGPIAFESCSFLTFCWILSSTFMLEIKTIHTPKGINVLNLFLKNLLQIFEKKNH